MKDFPALCQFPFLHDLKWALNERNPTRRRDMRKKTNFLISQNKFKYFTRIIELRKAHDCLRRPKLQIFEGIPNAAISLQVKQRTREVKMVTCYLIPYNFNPLQSQPIII